MVEVVDSDNNLTQYEYDAFGNRTATIYNGQRNEYLIDPFGYGDVIAEYDGDGNLIAKYEHGIGLVSRTDASNNQAFYDFDGTGLIPLINLYLSRENILCINLREAIYP